MTAGPATILVLNDAPEILALLRDVLSGVGYKVKTGLKPLTTVDELVAIDPDVLIIDFLWEQDRRGWDFLKAVRSDTRTMNLPILLCTTGGVALEEIQQDLKPMRVSVLLKPFALVDLLASVAVLLNT